MAHPVFNKIGGEKGVERMVDYFYNKVLSDVELAQFFYDVDTNRTKAKFKSYLTFALGGGEPFPENYLRDTHKHLVTDHGLCGHHFDLLVGKLESTMIGLGIDEESRGELLAIMEKTRGEILNKS